MFLFIACNGYDSSISKIPENYIKMLQVEKDGYTDMIKKNPKDYNKYVKRAEINKMEMQKATQKINETES